jgi:hypothetical protein
MAGRSSRVVPVEIAATEDDALYQRQRFFPPGDASPSGYAFALPPGVHRVTLHFAEIWFRVPGMRRRYETGPVRGRPASKASKPTGGGT